MGSLILGAGLATFNANSQEPDPDRVAIAVEALSRLKGVDLDANPAVRSAVFRVLDQVRGRPEFVRIVRDFEIKDQGPALVETAVRQASGDAGADAIRLLLEQDQADLLRDALAGTNAIRIAEALGNSGDRRAVPLLEPLLLDGGRDLALRKQGARALACTQDGAGRILQLAREDRLPGDLRFTAAMELHNAPWPAVKSAAAECLPLPQSQNAEPLPPISELLKRTGNTANGAAVYRRETVNCIRCHQVNGEGTDFGPALSEIGTKLGKDALYESILDPNAGISFGYEAWQIELKNGDEILGLVTSETSDELAIKAQTGIVTRYPKSDIVRREKQTLSIMPAGLQQAMSTEDLVDLVEYLASLKKRHP